MAKPKEYMRQYRAKKKGGNAAGLQKLIDSQGHISLDPKDYQGYSQADVEAFLVARPYETHVTFSPDGRVLEMSSNWKLSWVATDVGKQMSVVNSDGRSGCEDFHVHPDLGPGLIAIFSPADIGVNVAKIDYARDRGKTPPTKFTVLAYTGQRFTLEYTGRAERDPKNFKRAYTTAFNRSRKANSYSANTAKYVTEDMDSWLKGNAGKYGFTYTSIGV